MSKPSGFYTDKSDTVHPVIGEKYPHCNPRASGTANLAIPKRTIQQVQTMNPKTITEEKEVNEIIHNLKVIRDYGEFPKGKNYLFSRYKNMGLVVMGYKTTKTGAKVMDKVKLSKEGHKLARVQT